MYYKLYNIIQLLLLQQLHLSIYIWVTYPHYTNHSLYFAKLYPNMYVVYKSIIGYCSNKIATQVDISHIKTLAHNCVSRNIATLHIAQRILVNIANWNKFANSILKYLIIAKLQMRCMRVYLLLFWWLC